MAVRLLLVSRQIRVNYYLNKLDKSVGEIAITTRMHECTRASDEVVLQSRFRLMIRARLVLVQLSRFARKHSDLSVNE